MTTVTHSTLKSLRHLSFLPFSRRVSLQNAHNVDIALLLFVLTLRTLAEFGTAGQQAVVHKEKHPNIGLPIRVECPPNPHNSSFIMAYTYARAAGLLTQATLA